MAVADVFTAVAEDRPYRAGMEPHKVLDVLHGMVGNGALDGDVVEVLQQHYDQVDAGRIQQQKAYAHQQKMLYDLMGQPMMQGVAAT